MEEICGNCMFSRSKVEEDNKSWRNVMWKKSGSVIKFSCHITSPYMEGWPSVEDSDWCGRFEASE